MRLDVFKAARSEQAPSALRAPYSLSGTDVAYGDTRAWPLRLPGAEGM